MTNNATLASPFAPARLAEARKMLGKLRGERLRLDEEERTLRAEVAPPVAAGPDVVAEALLSGGGLAAAAAARKRRASARARLGELEGEAETLNRAIARQFQTVEALASEEGYRLSLARRPAYLERLGALVSAIEAALAAEAAVSEVFAKIRGEGLAPSALALPAEALLGPPVAAALRDAAQRGRAILAGGPA